MNVDSLKRPYNAAFSPIDQTPEAPSTSENLGTQIEKVLPAELFIQILDLADNPRTLLVSRNWNDYSKAIYIDIELFTRYRNNQTLRRYLPSELFEKPNASAPDYFQQVKEKVKEIRKHVIGFAQLPKVAKALKPISQEELDSLNIERLIEEIEKVFKNMSLFAIFRVVVNDLSQRGAPIPEIAREVFREGAFSESAATLIRTWLSKNPSACTQITRLDLSALNLRTLPREIALFSKVERLWLRDNDFIVFPEELRNLHALSFLELGFNKLTSFPEINQTKELSNLKTLYLDNNNIKEIPEETIRNLTKLNLLNLNNNKLTSFPTHLTKLPNLKTLDLSNNKLQRPSETLERDDLTVVLNKPVRQRHEGYTLISSWEVQFGTSLY